MLLIRLGFDMQKIAYIRRPGEGLIIQHEPEKEAMALLCQNQDSIVKNSKDHLKRKVECETMQSFPRWTTPQDLLLQ